MRTLCTVTEGASGASIVGLVDKHPAASVAAASTVTAKVARARGLTQPVAPAKERNIAANRPVAVTIGVVQQAPTGRTCPLQGFTKAQLTSRSRFPFSGLCWRKPSFAD
jgi:hypothetical protein